MTPRSQPVSGQCQAGGASQFTPSRVELVSPDCAKAVVADAMAKAAQQMAFLNGLHCPDLGMMFFLPQTFPHPFQKSITDYNILEESAGTP